MKKAYFSISFKDRKALEPEVKTISASLKEHGIEPIIFVDDYVFQADQEKEMMRLACRDIENSDLLVTELSNKAIGVGIEVGYAAALKKPIIYIKNKEAKYSKTVGGLSTIVIEYADTKELRDKMNNYLDIL